MAAKRSFVCMYIYNVLCWYIKLFDIAYRVCSISCWLSIHINVVINLAEFLPKRYKKITCKQIRICCLHYMISCMCNSETLPVCNCGLLLRRYWCLLYWRLSVRLTGGQISSFVGHDTVASCSAHMLFLAYVFQHTVEQGCPTFLTGGPSVQISN